MDDREWPAERFEEHRTPPEGGRLPMLGSLGEAADAVQEALLGLNRTDEERPSPASRRPRP
jgi:DNA-directed RNA polymerase specialized sigma24 family protein